VSTDTAAPLDDLRLLRHVVGRATVVGLGESTHGSHEQFGLKHRIVRFLVERMGFRTLAFEDDFASGVALDTYVVTGHGDPSELVASMSSPFWNSAEIIDLLRWLRSYNVEHPNDPVRFLGTDVLQLRQPSFDAIVDYVTTRFAPPGPAVPHIDLEKGDLAIGQQVYQEHCASCHATTGIGGAMLIHPNEDEPRRTRGIVIPNFDHSGVQAVAEAVRTGPGSMPVFGTRAISDHELESLLVYMGYLKDPADEGGAPIGRIGPVVEGAVGWLVGLGALLLVIRWIGTKAGEVE
jgi:mono/diheme cytochrome c family protein